MESLIKRIFFLLMASVPLIAGAQNDQKENAPIQQVTVFKSGAQIKHTKAVQLSAGKQVVIFEKLTDFVDPNSIQLKCSSNATILSVRTRKNFDETAIAKQDVKTMNEKRDLLEKQEIQLRGEYAVLLQDEQLLLKNNDLGSQQVAVKITELKEASTFFHNKLTEIQSRKSHIEEQIETIIRAINEIEQEINTRRSLPVKNYTEIRVELNVEAAGKTDFEFSYITPNASWKPYYDMRSNGVGAPVLLEAKGLVTQNTGENWDKVELILSTNDPYDNTQEPLIEPWRLNYYTPAPTRPPVAQPSLSYNYAGETIYGEVIDAVTGEPLAFAKIQPTHDPNAVISTDAAGRFSFIVPRGENMYTVSYLGYNSQSVTINSPYRKIMLEPEDVVAQMITEQQEYTWSHDYNAASNSTSEVQIAAMKRTETIDAVVLESRAIQRIPSVSFKRKRNARSRENSSSSGWDYEEGERYETYNKVVATTIEKDLRMEFLINTPFTIPSDNADHRVAIATYEMPANYEYHAVPKLDESVYLVAQISGWEKLNLLSGESNIYFDGTFIGKSYVDVNSTKDTLSFSLGKDRKLIVERKRSDELSKTRVLGNRTKYEVQWDFTIRNNGAAAIPLTMKDHFPISVNDDIKVKQGTYEGALLDEKTGILTWKYFLNKGETKKVSFNYSVDHSSKQPVYLE